AIGTGEKVDVWRDVWCDDIPMLQLINNIDHGLPPMKVSDLIDLTTREWNLGAITPYVAPVSLDRIRALPIAQCDPCPDSRIWSPSKDGSVTVKYCYNWLINTGGAHSLDGSKWKSLW
ncbi:hypothetical protein MKX03_006196, partial [Papaver bracteatum]